MKLLNFLSSPASYAMQWASVIVFSVYHRALSPPWLPRLESVKKFHLKAARCSSPSGHQKLLQPDYTKFPFEFLHINVTPDHVQHFFLRINVQNSHIYSWLFIITPMTNSSRPSGNFSLWNNFLKIRTHESFFLFSFLLWLRGNWDVFCIQSYNSSIS